MDASIFDEDIFSQILEMDDDEERSFSKGLVTSFFEQAEKTFTEMTETLYCA